MVDINIGLQVTLLCNEENITRMINHSAQFSKAYNNTVENVLGRKRKSSKPWISPESWAKVEERKQLKGKVENAKSERIQQELRAKYRSKDKEVKKSLKSDKRKWLNSLMDDAQRAVDMGNMKTLYGITKTICNERTHKKMLLTTRAVRPSQMTPAGWLDGKNTLKRSSADHHP